MDVLLEYNQDLNFKNKKGQTILHKFFEQNSNYSTQFDYDNKLALKIVEKGAPIDVVDACGNTPFHMAADQNRPEVLSKMLDRDVNIYVRNKCKMAIWRVAMDKLMDCQYEETIIALIRQGVDVNEKNQKGTTPVQTAATFKQTKLLRVLEEYGADFTVLNGYNENLLHLISMPLNGSIRRADKSTVDLLISHNCDVNAVNKNGLTPLQLACQIDNNVEVAKALIEHGAIIHSQEVKTRRTPLHWASCMGEVELVKCLINLGAEVDCRDTLSRTPTHLAAENNQIDVIKILAQSGANIEALAGYAFLMMRTALQTKTQDQAYDVVKTLFELRVRINFQERNQCLLLHEAVSGINLKVVKCLLENGASVSDQDDFCKRTPLHLAAMTRDKDIDRVLMKRGVDINCLTQSELTPLRGAIVKDNDDVIKCLIDYGADINARDSIDRTPLNYGVFFSGKSLGTLLELGPDMDLLDFMGYTALQQALFNGNRTAFDWLIEFGADINDIGTENHDLFLYRLMEKRFEREILMQHLIKLQTLGFPVSETLKSYLELYINDPEIKSMRQECLNEMKLLEKTMIDGEEDSSLFKILHMDPYKRYPFFKGKEFKQILDRKTRKSKYPMYSDIIMASYRETMSHEKHFLMIPARSAWYNLTNIYLPEICVKHIITYLALGDLKRMVEGDENV